jgi:hypothetical protein
MEKQANCKYYLYKKYDHSYIYLGYGIYDSMTIAPLLSADNRNVFGRSFGIEI